MAANLNRPADFLSRREKELVNPPVLLPPSEFLKPKSKSDSGSSSIELEKANRIIQDLKVDNENLRALSSQVQQQAAVTSFSSVHNEYADELIKRQAGEVAELRKELARCRELYEQEGAEWERKLSALENEYREEERRKERDIRMKEDEYEQRLSRVSSELQRTMETAEEEGRELRGRLEVTKSSLGSQVKGLEVELEALRRERQETSGQLEAELRSKSRQVEDQQQQITQLKTYIGEVEESQRPAAAWRAQKETSDNKLRVSVAERQRLESELELVGVRLRAMEDMMQLQDKQMAQSRSKHSGKEKPYEDVLSGWRRKVYDLFIQQKSTEIVNQNDINNLKLKITDLEDQLKESHVRAEFLEHALKEKSALLQIESNNKMKLQDDFDQVQQVAECLDDESKLNSQHLAQLKLFIDRHGEKNAEITKVLEEKCGMLKGLSQRVSFAANRMEYLKAQFLRKTALTGLTKTGLTTCSTDHNDSRKSLSVSRVDENMSRDSEEHLYQELERVMRERDSLASQVQGDTTKWSKRLHESQAQYRTDVSSLKKTVESLEYDVQTKSKTNKELTEELTALTESLKEREDTIAELQAELARHMKGVHTVLSDQHLRDEAEFNNQLADVERKLNESRREHAKTVVSLRQLERSQVREQQRSEDLLRTTEDHMTRHIQQLKAQLASVDRERNIVMATLRQEGLLHKLKTSRGEPTRLTLEEVDTALRHGLAGGAVTPPAEAQYDFLHRGVQKDVHNEVEGHSEMEGQGRQDEDNVRHDPNLSGVPGTDEEEDEETPQHYQPQEPVEKVLEDLKSLTEAIFADEEDELDREDRDEIDDKENFAVHSEHGEDTSLRNGDNNEDDSQVSDKNS